MIFRVPTKGGKSQISTQQKFEYFIRDYVLGEDIEDEVKAEFRRVNGRDTEGHHRMIYSQIIKRINTGKPGKDILDLFIKYDVDPALPFDQQNEALIQLAVDREMRKRQAAQVTAAQVKSHVKSQAAPKATVTTNESWEDQVAALDAAATVAPGQSGPQTP